MFRAGWLLLPTHWCQLRGVVVTLVANSLEMRKIYTSFIHDLRNGWFSLTHFLQLFYIYILFLAFTIEKSTKYSIVRRRQKKVAFDEILVDSKLYLLCFSLSHSIDIGWSYSGNRVYKPRVNNGEHSNIGLNETFCDDRNDMCSKHGNEWMPRRTQHTNVSSYFPSMAFDMYSNRSN